MPCHQDSSFQELSSVPDAKNLFSPQTRHAKSEFCDGQFKEARTAAALVGYFDLVVAPSLTTYLSALRNAGPLMIRMKNSSTAGRGRDTFRSEQSNFFPPLLPCSDVHVASPEADPALGHLSRTLAQGVRACPHFVRFPQVRENFAVRPSVLRTRPPRNVIIERARALRS